MNTLIGIERLPWLDAGNKANTGATGATALQTVKVIDAEWTLFECHPTAPYNDGYWYQKKMKDNPTLAPSMASATDFTQGMRFVIPGHDYAATRCIESEVQKAKNNHIWNMAWQGRIGADVTYGIWRYYDYANTTWRSLKIPLPCRIKPDTEHHIYFHAKLVDVNIQHISFNFDDVDQHIVVPLIPYAVKTVNDMLNVGFQLDTQKTLGTARAMVKQMNLKWQ
jgi:hypothetical protein